VHGEYPAGLRLSYDRPDGEGTSLALSTQHQRFASTLFLLDGDVPGQIMMGQPGLLEGEPANTFLRSLFLVPPDVLKAAAKEKAVKMEAAGKENLEKFGFKWTMALKDMTPPDSPAAGLLRGKEFKPDTATIQGGNLNLRQGTGVFPEGEVFIAFLIKNGGSAENKTIEIPPGGSVPGGKPHVRITTMEKNARLPKNESFVDKYALKVTFGAKDANGDIPGTIYLCTPDASRSFVAGSFTVKKN